MKTFLVIGLWPEDGGRWADSFEAETPQEAEAAALELYGDELQIAGVVTLDQRGDMEVVA